MRKNILLVLLVFCQLSVFSQDKKVLKVADYIAKGKDTKAKKLLDELDNKKEFQSDIYYWYVRTVYYRNIALSNTSSTNELAEARKSFEKLVEFNKKDSSKSLTEYIPQIKKDLYEGKNQINTSGSNARSSSISQADDGGKTVTLTQIGEGNTKEAAKNNALRNVIEKAFGAFISSNTTILNDILIKDEIVSVSSGNIQNFEVLFETQMPDGSFSSVVKATVSIGRLITFCENKGVSVEFKGGLFAANIKLQELNEKNEKEVMRNLFFILNEIVKNGFDYSIDVSEPKKANYPYNDWLVKFSITATSNDNLKNIKEITMSTINNICLTPVEITSYSNKNLRTYGIIINGKNYRFRSRVALIYLLTIFESKIPLASLNFSVSDGISTFNSVSMLSNGKIVNKKRIDVKENLPYAAPCNPDIRGYGPSIYVNYSVLYNIYRQKIRHNEAVSDFLRNVSTLNFDKINNQFSRNGGGFNWIDDAYTGNYKPELDLSFSRPILIKYCFKKIYSLEQLSKVTEYKVQPIIK